MASAEELLESACSDDISAVAANQLWVIIAQILAEQVGKDAEELLEDACDSGISSLRGKDLLVVIAQLLNGGTTPPVSCTVTTASLPDGITFTLYEETLTASEAATWAITAGALPTGLTLVGDSIEGTPEEAGTFPFTVQATTASGTCTKDLSITIADFEPPQLGSMYLWVRPESLEGQADNTPLVTWPDESGSGNDLTGTGPTWRTTGGPNGFGRVSFDGINDFASTVAPAVPATTVYTAFVVFTNNNVGGTETALQVGNLSGYALLKDTGNREIVHRAVAALVDGAMPDAGELWVARKTAAPLTTLRVNGAGVAITNSGSAMNAPDNLITLGSFVGAGLFLQGDIMEVLLYDTALSDADRDTVENYLIRKYGF